jgi:hypothetical protein
MFGADYTHRVHLEDFVGERIPLYTSFDLASQE